MSDPHGRPFEPPGADLPLEEDAPEGPAFSTPREDAPEAPGSSTPREDAPEAPGSSTPREDAPEAPGSSTPQGVPPPPVQPPDVNLEAIDRAGLPPEFAAWLREVALQVDGRLDRIAPRWRAAPHAAAARACAFGLLLGQLDVSYPQVRDQLSRTAEAHPSFGTLAAGNRLETLRQIATDPPRMAAWLGPLVDADDTESVRRLLD